MKVLSTCTSLLLLSVVVFDCHAANAGTMLYMVEQRTDALWTLDTNSGASTLVGPLGVNVTYVGMAYDGATDTFLVSDGPSDNLYRVSPRTGTATLVGGIGVRNVSGLAMHPGTGLLYGASGPTNQIYSIDPSTAAATLIGSVGFNLNVSGLAYRPGNDTLYLNEINTDSLYTVDITNGSLTLVGANLVPNIMGLAYDTSSDLLFGVSGVTDSLYSIDRLTGVASLVGSVNFDAINNGLAFRPDPAAAVPEPTVFVVFLYLGIFGTCSRRARPRMPVRKSTGRR